MSFGAVIVLIAIVCLTIGSPRAAAVIGALGMFLFTRI